MRFKGLTAMLASAAVAAGAFALGTAQAPEPAEAQRADSAARQLQQVDRRLGRLEDKLVQNGRTLLRANRDRDDLLTATNALLAQIEANTQPR